MWPENGDGRIVKAATENVIRRLDGPQPVRALKIAFGELDYAVEQLKIVAVNPFFQAEFFKRKAGGKRSGRDFIGNELLELLDEYASYRDVQEAAMEIEVKQAIRATLPEQKLSPAKFTFDENGVLRIQHEPIASIGDDQRVADNSRSAVLELGNRILENFHQSNLDQRVGTLISEVQEAVRSKQDIIRCGFKRLVLENTVQQLRDEAPAILYSELATYSSGVGLYVSMHPDWQKFTEHAAIVDVNPIDVRQVYHAGRTLISALEKAGPAVDPEVPKTLSWIFEAIRDPKLASKRALFGAWRALENLASKVFGAGIDLIGSAKHGVQMGVKVSAGLLTLAVIQAVASSTSLVPPTIAQAMHGGWVPEIAKKFQDLIKPD